MDELDQKILQVLGRDGRAALAEIARQVGVSRQTVNDRVARLESSGILRGATVMIDYPKAGFPIRAFLLVKWKADEFLDQREVARRITEIKGVLRVHVITGEHDFLVEVVARDMDHIGRIIVERVRAIPGVSGTHTMISFWDLENQNHSALG